MNTQKDAVERVRELHSQWKKKLPPHRRFEVDEFGCKHYPDTPDPPGEVMDLVKFVLVERKKEREEFYNATVGVFRS